MVAASAVAAEVAGHGDPSPHRLVGGFPASREETTMITGALMVILVIVLLVVGLIGFVIGGFNKLRRTDIGAQEALDAKRTTAPQTQ